VTGHRRRRARAGMGLTAVLAAVLAAAAAFAPLPARAQEPDAVGTLITWTEIAFDPHSKSYKQYEAYVNWRLPWDWQGPGGWAGHTAFQATVGHMWINKVRGDLVSLGPLASIDGAGGLLTFHAGFRPTFLTRTTFGSLGVGTHIQFTSHIGVLIRPLPHLAVGWRLQHMSNGGLKTPNPGVNLSTFEVRAEW
jgi:lipid A 3-O-deacylase